MSADDERIATLQRQIVEMRMRLDQQSEANAALMDHAAARAVTAAMGGRGLTEDEREWVRRAAKAEGERRRIWGDITMHVLKWGVGGAIGFILYSVWESVKAKVKAGL